MSWRNDEGLIISLVEKVMMMMMFGRIDNASDWLINRILRNLSIQYHVRFQVNKVN